MNRRMSRRSPRRPARCPIALGPRRAARASPLNRNSRLSKFSIKASARIVEYSQGPHYAEMVRLDNS